MTPVAVALAGARFSDSADPSPIGRNARRRYFLNATPELHTCGRADA